MFKISSLIILCLNFYHQNVSEKKILLLAPVKNAEKGFERSKRNIEKFASYFLDYRIIIYENNSTDRTKLLYQGWAQQQPKLIFISEDLDTQAIIKVVKTLRGSYSTELIARARNILLDEAFQKEYEDYDYLLMADLDAFSDWDIEEMLDSLCFPKKEWDAILPAATYDLYAIRGDQFLYNPDLFSGLIWYNLQDKTRKFYTDYLNQADWIKVESAFGGLCLFKKKAVENIRYKGLMSPEYLTHVLNRDLSSDLMLKSYPYLGLEVERYKKKLRLWELSGFNSKQIPTNGFTCEHAQFFFNMRSHGRDRIYINPKWKHYSEEHRN
jgi:hypothetical protein